MIISPEYARRYLEKVGAGNPQDPTTGGAGNALSQMIFGRPVSDQITDLESELAQYQGQPANSIDDTTRAKFAQLRSLKIKQAQAIAKGGYQVPKGQEYGALHPQSLYGAWEAARKRAEKPETRTWGETLRGHLDSVSKGLPGLEASAKTAESEYLANPSPETRQAWESANAVLSQNRLFAQDAGKNLPRVLQAEQAQEHRRQVGNRVYHMGGNYYGVPGVGGGRDVLTREEILARQDLSGRSDVQALLGLGPQQGAPTPSAAPAVPPLATGIPLAAVPPPAPGNPQSPKSGYTPPAGAPDPNKDPHGWAIWHRDNVAKPVQPAPGIGRAPQMSPDAAANLEQNNRMVTAQRARSAKITRGAEIATGRPVYDLTDVPGGPARAVRPEPLPPHRVSPAWGGSASAAPATYPGGSPTPVQAGASQAAAPVADNQPRGTQRDWDAMKRLQKNQAWFRARPHAQFGKPETWEPGYKPPVI